MTTVPRQGEAAMPVSSVALVTGGAGGLGAEISRALARRGMPVAVNYFSNASRADALVQEIGDAGGRAIAVAGDVRDPGAIRSMLASVAEKLGTPTVLVNAAIGDIGLRSRSSNRPTGRSRARARQADRAGAPRQDPSSPAGTDG